MQSRLALAWVLAAGACGFKAPGDGAATPDGSGGRDACASFSAQLDTCQLPPGFALTLSGPLTFDTDTGVLAGPSGQITVFSMPVPTLGAEVRVLLATTVDFEVGTVLRATGSRGFAIVATGNITMRAGVIIDVSGGGAGHRMDCGSAAASNGEEDADGGAGGGGGGFGAEGGGGGNGDADMGQSAGGAGGAMAPLPAGPFGGCPGGLGGKDTGTTNEGGTGGRGGGAVYLVSAVAIGISTGAGIHAGGDGGGGGERDGGSGDAGGGGGGSGGSIFLEAPVIRSEGILAANGGGGGEGSGNSTAGRPGMPGVFGIGRAPGGTGGSTAGADGGAGGHVGNPAGARQMLVQNGGGGGGGGGVGYIRVSSGDYQLGVNVSPELK